MEWHGASAQASPKIKHRGTIVLPGVRAERLTDEGFWTMLYGMSGHWPSHDQGKLAQMGARVVYDTMLPWLAEAPMSAVTSPRHLPHRHHHRHHRHHHRHLYHHHLHHPPDVSHEKHEGPPDLHLVQQA